MGAHFSRFVSLSLAGMLLVLPGAAHSQKKSKHQKPPDPKIENYYGGVFLLGDGAIPNGACFRINGRVTSGDFFNELKSYDTDDGMIFREGTTEVTQFPDKVVLSLEIHDEPCGTGVYLTHDAMSSLKLTLYWKHGLEMHPVSKITLLHSSVSPIQPYATNLAAELPKRYLWSYELGIPSEGVPLTDSLVLVFRTADGHIAARVAARL
jgi:hypothetical protein